MLLARGSRAAIWRGRWLHRSASRPRSPRSSAGRPLSRSLGFWRPSRPQRAIETARASSRRNDGRRLASRLAVPAGGNVAAFPGGDRRVAVGPHNAGEDVVALPSRCGAQGRPNLTLAIHPDRPGEGAAGRGSLGLGATPGGCVIGTQELRRVELARNTDARSFALAKIPDGLAVPGDLTVKVRRQLRRHCRIMAHCLALGQGMPVDHVPGVV